MKAVTGCSPSVIFMGMPLHGCIIAATISSVLLIRVTLSYIGQRNHYINSDSEPLNEIWHCGRGPLFIVYHVCHRSISDHVSFDTQNLPFGCGMYSRASFCYLENFCVTALLQAADFARGIIGAAN